MQPIHPSSLADLTADEMQMLAQEVFPPAQTFTFEPWEARFTPEKDGTYTSVRTTTTAPPDLATALSTFRQWYAKFSAPLVLQLVDPHPLDSYFEVLGWTTRHRGVVMYRPLHDHIPHGPKGKFGEGSASVSLDLDRDLDRDGVLHISAVMGSEIAGTGEALRLRAPSVAPVAVGLRSVGTSEQFRRRGVATRVAAAAEDWAASMNAAGVVLLVLQDNEPAISLYESMGYTIHHCYRFIEEVDNGDR